MADQRNNYGKWSKEELRKAEATAKQFLEDNGNQISETLRTKVKYLDVLVNRLATRRSTSMRGWIVSPGLPKSPSC